MPSHLTINISKLIKILLLAALLALCGVVVFCIFYLSHSHEYLQSWFVSLHSCFYRVRYWPEFFSGGVKLWGDRYCVVALVVAVVCGSYALWSLRKKGKVSITVIFSKPDIIAVSMLLVAATLLWAWAYSMTYPSNDEVFSAENCAGLHPFQTMAYYMLPNNHILFNLVNNFLFHFAADKVPTGRLISLACYWVIVMVSYFMAIGLFGKRWLAMLVVLMVALQFPIWGFAAQARGYELMAAAEWVVFFSVYRYCQGGSVKWLYVATIAIVAGYFTIPTFLYFHAAVVLFLLHRELVHRQLDFALWKHQVVAAACVFLLYVPCLCFSGTSAISDNKYVLAHSTSTSEVLVTFQNYLDYCFFSLLSDEHWVDAVLFFMPLALFFFKSKQARLLGWFYSVLWLSIVLLTLKLHVFALDRALTGQLSLTLFVCLFACYEVFSSAGNKINKPALATAAVVILFAGITANFVFKGSKHMNHYLCHFPVNDWHQILSAALPKIPGGSSVACSEESFYMHYLLKHNGYNTTQCSTANEDFFINRSEPFPPGIEDGYIRCDSVADFYFYKKKPGK